MQDRLIHNERDRKYHDVIAVEYEQLVNEPRTYINDLLFEPLLAQIRHPVVKVLDLGCGTGQMVRRLHERFRPESITAVDHSIGMLEMLKRQIKSANLNVTVVNSELIEFISQTTEPYDLISCVGVLHHLTKPDVATLLSRCRELLNANGSVLIAEPIDNATLHQPSGFIQRWNQNSIASNLHYSVQTADVEDPDEYPLDEGELEQLLKAANFDIQQKNCCVEMFPQNDPPSFADRCVIRFVQRRYRTTGFIQAVLAR